MSTSGLTNSIKQNSISNLTTNLNNNTLENNNIISTNNNTRFSTPINQNNNSTTTATNNLKPSPVLLNILGAEDSESILVLVVEEEDKNKVSRVYGGSQGGDIHVWNLQTLALTARLTGHEGAVLALLIISTKNWLVSSSGDGTIRIWNTLNLTSLYLIHPPHDNVGDVFSLVWVREELLDDGDGEVEEEEESSENLQKKVGKKERGRLFAGSQDTSIQWIDLPPTFHLPTPSSSLSPSSSSSSAPTHSIPPKSIPLPISSPHHLPHSSTSTASNSNSYASSSPPIHRAPNKFFDSLTLADISRPLSSLGGGRRFASTGQVNGGIGGSGAGSDNEGSVGDSTSAAASAGCRVKQVVELQFEDNNVVTYAHYGYLYCLELGKSNEKNVLVSGSGDELIKLWKMTQDSLLPIATLESNSDAILTLAVKDNTAFAGHQGGNIKIWDLDTLTCIRNLKPHKFDILTISLSPSLNSSTDFYAGSSDGTLLHFDKSFNLISTWKAHDRIVLASTISLGKGIGGGGGRHLLTGGNDAVIKIWDIGEMGELVEGVVATGGFQGQLFHSLSKLVSFKTIADDEHREDCRQGANYLKRVLRQLGAETLLLRGALDRNPIVLATFKANSSIPIGNSKNRKRVLFYGHYDVVGAPPTTSSTWKQDPFEMKGENGWIYGRGVSDNKGPILAVAAAASELRANGNLEVDLVMVVEGEEETGSAGFQEAIQQNRELIGDIDVILVSNSYWIGEDLPCLTFGLRGVIHATVSIDSDQPDLHSGMQGGVVSEPLVDMVRVLASLTDSDGRVRIPGFLEDVRKLDAKESALYDEIILRCANGGTDDKLPKHSHIPDPRRSLMVRWRQPALSIHKIEVSSQAQKTLIPSWAKSSVSIRIVPDQPLTVICEQLKSHLQKAFKSLSTYNSLTVDINHVADWWLGDVDNPYFQSFAKCIEKEWSIKPLCIREGGSIPSLPFLQRELGAPAILYPMGLSSDSAHLANERIPIINLERGKTIVSNWLSCISKLP